MNRWSASARGRQVAARASLVRVVAWYPGWRNSGRYHDASIVDRDVGLFGQPRAWPQNGQHSVQPAPGLDHFCPLPRRPHRGLRYLSDRLVHPVGQGTAASDRHRHPLVDPRPGHHADGQRPRLLAGRRPLEPQGHAADRRDCDSVLYAPDPAGTERRAADHRAGVDRNSAPAASSRRRSRSRPN